MAQTTIQVTCRDCGMTFEHVTCGSKAGGRVTKALCASCLKESQRKATREHKTRKRAAAKAARPHRTCLDCPTDISELHGKTLRCENCRKEKARTYQQALRDQRGSRARSFYCVRCGTVIDRIGNSGRPVYCAPCGLEVRRASARRADRKRRPSSPPRLVTHCLYCGGQFDKPRRRPSRCHPRCQRCKVLLHNEYMRNRATERIANARCVECGGCVGGKRKGPRSRCSDCSESRARARFRQYAHRRRARTSGAGSEEFLSIEIYERDGWRCGLCRGRIRRSLRYPHPLSASLDHIIPISLGGMHTRSNVMAAHLRCNLAKKNKPMGEQLLLFG